MKKRSFILRYTAFFLMLIFFQKAGGGLLYHNFFHCTVNDQPADNTGKTVGLSCSCIDDFVVPFEEAVEQPPVIFLSPHVAVSELAGSSLPFVSSVYSSLRGPPAIAG